MKIDYWRESTRFIWLIILAGSFMGCLRVEDYQPDNIARISWNPKYAVPLVFGELSLTNILNSEDSASLKTYPDGQYYFLYEKRLETREIGELVDIPDQEVNRTYRKFSPVTIPSFESYLLFDTSEVIRLNLVPEKFYTAGFKSGKLHFQVESSINADIEIQIILPSATKDGAPFTATINSDRNNPIATINLELDNYDFAFNSNDPGYNTLPIETKVTIRTYESGVIVQPTDDFSFKLSLTDIEPSHLTGYFGRQSTPLPEDFIKVGPLGETFGGATLNLKDSRISLLLSNEYGVPIEVDLERFDGIKDGNEFIPLETLPANPFMVKAPVLPGNIENTVIDVTNSSEVFNFRPDQLFYSASATINPTDQEVLNFLSDTSNMVLDLKAEIPLYGSVRGLILSDTVSVSFSESVQDSETEEALIRVFLQNQFPLDAFLQIYFTDEQYNLTDSLLNTSDQHLIKAARVDQNGNSVVGGEGISEKLIKLDNQKFQNLLNAAYLIIRSEMATYKSPEGIYPDVRFKKGQNLSVDIGIQTELNILINP
jgi:hypothetical protein